MMKSKCMAGLLIACMALATAFAAEGPEKLADPRLEARAVALQRQLRCVVCQGESLDESGAPLAEDLRRLIRAHIEKGESDAQVRQYLIARYGDFILMKPPLESETIVLWFGPLGMLVIGGASVAVAVVRARVRLRKTARINET